MKIMVTGGMGFVGSHLCENLLKENHNLIILTKSFKKKHNVEGIKTKVKQEKIDVTNFSKLGKSIVKNNGENPYSNPSPKPHFYPLIWQQIRMNNLSLNLAPDCGVQYSSSRNVFGSERVAFSDPLRLYLHVTCARISDYTLSERDIPIVVFFVLNLIGENQW